MKINRRVIYVVIAVAIILFLFLNEGFRTVVRRYWELGKLSQKIEQLKKQNGVLRKEIYLFEHDTSYIEYTARRDLGVNAPGEVEYRFKK